MSYAFKKIGATNILENAPDNANVVCEVGGEVNRVPATKIGGGGIKVAIIKRAGSGYSCDNMTYEEAVEYLTNGVPFLIYISYGTRYTIVVTAEYSSSNDRIDFADKDDMGKTIVFHWTSTGISAGGLS